MRLGITSPVVSLVPARHSPAGIEELEQFADTADEPGCHCVREVATVLSFEGRA